MKLVSLLKRRQNLASGLKKEIEVLWYFKICINNKKSQQHSLTFFPQKLKIVHSRIEKKKKKPQFGGKEIRLIEV